MASHAKYMASTIVSHAYRSVSEGHTWKPARGAIKFGRFVKHSVGETWRSTRRGDLAAIGIGLGSGAAVAVAGTVLTGGLAPAAIAGIAGGTYLVRKLVQNVSFERGRLNRNWLHNYSQAASHDASNYANTLGVEAKDAIRRAIDHYNITRSILHDELKPLDGKEIETCNDAINKAKATARFIHHSDKTRNYLLPCMDLSIFLLLQYKELTTSWNRYNGHLETSLEAYFEHHARVRSLGCTQGGKCYLSHSTLAPPLRPLYTDGFASPSFEAPKADNSVDAGGSSIDIMKLVNALATGSVKSIEQAMTRNAYKPKASWNFHSAIPQIHVQNVTFLGMRLIQDAYAAADRPGYLAQVGRKVRHAVSRRTRGEIAIDVLGELVAAGSAANAFIPSMEIGKILKATVDGAALIRGGITGTTTLASVIAGSAVLSSNGELAASSGLMDWTLVENSSGDAVLAAGVKVQEVITKTGTHFLEAFEACKALEQWGGRPLESCDDAWEFSVALAAALYHMKKMERYLMTTLSLLAHIGDETVKWSEYEPLLWGKMEEEIADWMDQPGLHHDCLAAHTHCYGPMRQGHAFESFDNLIDRVYVRDDPSIGWGMPHKPL